MLFPNHPAYAEIRAGMGDLGYQPGAHALLGYAAPAHDLGDFSASMENAAVDAGISINDIELLNSLGATDQDLSDLINGNITLTQLYAKFGVTIPGGGGVVPTTATPTTPASASVTPSQPAPSAPPAQSPPGSTLLYTASYAALKAWTTSAAAIQALSPLLPSHGMSIESQQVSSSGLWSSDASFSISVLDSVGHALISDAKSVLDALMQQITNNGLKSSSLTLVAPGTTASGQPAAAATTAGDAVAWLENNAIYIGGAVLALVLVNNFTGGRRR
jgi:hypothetical protein